jgi:hypothetical protein
MTKPKRTLAEQIADADERGSRWLAEANAAAERGNYQKAEALYDKASKWLDESNRLRGNGS